MKAKILHKTPKGFLIGRGCKEVKIGSVVIFKNKEIGKVIDIFGPVKSPYIKIRPSKKHENGEVNGTVEIIFPQRYGNKNKKTSKNRRNRKR
ncbi:MAG: hypothetical protein GXN95_02590 [Methanococci archaeon]|nr:hypothetical protein [Methanococci archaeon]